MVLVVAAVSLAMTLRAIEPVRWMYWWSFSRRWAVGGLIVILGILSLVSVVGVLVSHVGDGGYSPRWIQDLAAALLAHSSLRRLRTKDRGGTLALGVLPDAFKWVDSFVGQRVVAWAESLQDAELIAAAARTDDKLKGIPRPGTLEKRVAWREAASRRLEAGGALRDESRHELVSLIEVGYSTYLLRKPR